MKHWYLSVVLMVASAWADMPLTLDPAVVEEVKSAVFNGALMVGEDEKTVKTEEQGDIALWQQAMDAAGTELMPVKLLALLQRLNPDKPMESYAALYADTLRLHVLAAAGNREARMQLAAALRVGMLPGGMRIICAASKAEALMP